MESDQVSLLLARQKALANFGGFAFRENRLSLILEEAARVTSQCFNVPLVKVCRYRPDHGDLIVEAGFGWRDGIVGHATQQANHTSPGGRALVSDHPVIIDDLRSADDYSLPAFYGEYGIISTANAIIKGVDNETWGILEIDSPEQHEYNEHDLDFLRGFANVLAEAVATATRIADLKQSLIEKEILLVNQAMLMAKQDKLIVENDILTDELQRRVRNNLQSIYMLLRQGKVMKGDSSVLISAVADRVLMLSQVYEHLAEDNAGFTIDFAAYLISLCASLETLYSIASHPFKIKVGAKPFHSDIAQATSIALVLSELVRQSFEHGANQVTIKFSIINNRPSLTLRDDTKNVFANGGERMKMVRHLVEQIDGILDVRSYEPDHTYWMLVLPAILLNA